MKYRIEEGEAKVPLSEINRLNDAWEELEEFDKVLNKKREDINERIAQFNKQLEDEKAILIEAVALEGKEIKKQTEGKFFVMSTLEFKNWKKGIDRQKNQCNN